MGVKSGKLQAWKDLTGCDNDGLVSFTAGNGSYLRVAVVRMETHGTYTICDHAGMLFLVLLSALADDSRNIIRDHRRFGGTVPVELSLGKVTKVLRPIKVQDTVQRESGDLLPVLTAIEMYGQTGEELYRFCVTS
jgi:hypothetical protein